MVWEVDGSDRIDLMKLLPQNGMDCIWGQGI